MDQARKFAHPRPLRKAAGDSVDITDDDLAAAELALIAEITGELAGPATIQFDSGGDHRYAGK